MTDRQTAGTGSRDFIHPPRPSAAGIVCWGSNIDGELGNGSSAAMSAVPVSVVGFP
jgi:hypothetical protein